MNTPFRVSAQVKKQTNCEDSAMEKICPICQKFNTTISANLSDKELFHIHDLGIDPKTCKTCYIELLTNRLESTKSILIPLKQQKDITQAAYYEAYKSWEAQANIYKALDYNLSLINYETNKKAERTAKLLEKENITKKDKPAKVNIQTLTQKILSSLTPDQQEAIMRNFNQNMGA